MCRFLPGSESPPPKKVKSKEDVSESTKIYVKSKRQRAFQNCWKQGRTWLVFDDKGDFFAGLQRCGCVSKSQEQFYLRKLQEESRNHKLAKAIVAAKNRPCETPAVKFLLVVNS